MTSEWKNQVRNKRVQLQSWRVVSMRDDFWVIDSCFLVSFFQRNFIFLDRFHVVNKNFWCILYMFEKGVFGCGRSTFKSIARHFLWNPHRWAHPAPDGRRHTLLRFLLVGQEGTTISLLQASLHLSLKICRGLGTWMDEKWLWQKKTIFSGQKSPSSPQRLRNNSSWLRSISSSECFFLFSVALDAAHAKQIIIIIGATRFVWKFWEGKTNPFLQTLFPVCWRRKQCRHRLRLSASALPPDASCFRSCQRSCRSPCDTILAILKRNASFPCNHNHPLNNSEKPLTYSTCTRKKSTPHQRCGCPLGASRKNICGILQEIFVQDLLFFPEILGALKS